MARCELTPDFWFGRPTCLQMDLPADNVSSLVQHWETIKEQDVMLLTSKYGVQSKECDDERQLRTVHLHGEYSDVHLVERQIQAWLKGYYVVFMKKHAVDYVLRYNCPGRTVLIDTRYIGAIRMLKLVWVEAYEEDIGVFKKAIWYDNGTTCPPPGDDSQGSNDVEVVEWQVADGQATDNVSVADCLATNDASPVEDSGTENTPSADSSATNDSPPLKDSATNDALPVVDSATNDALFVEDSTLYDATSADHSVTNDTSPISATNGALPIEDSATNDAPLVVNSAMNDTLPVEDSAITHAPPLEDPEITDASRVKDSATNDTVPVEDSATYDAALVEDSRINDAPPANGAATNYIQPGDGPVNNGIPTCDVAITQDKDNDSVDIEFKLDDYQTNNNGAASMYDFHDDTSDGRADDPSNDDGPISDEVPDSNKVQTGDVEREKENIQQSEKKTTS